MAKIAVDIDDTVYSFSNLAKDALFHLAKERDDKNLLRAAYTPADQWRTPHDVAGDVWLEAIDLAHRPEVIKGQPPFPGAVKTLWALFDEDHELVYISNRDEKATEPTRDWLLNNDFPIQYSGSPENLPELKCLWGDKLPHIEDCQYIIDDRPSTLIKFVNDPNWSYVQERHGFGIHSPYNTNLTDFADQISLAPTWAGLNYFFVNQGLLKEAAYDPFQAMIGVK